MDTLDYVSTNSDFGDVIDSFNEAQACGWIVNIGDETRVKWLEIRPRKIVQRNQGWKLHVSATIGSAIDVLHAVLPHLRAAGVSFKVSNSLSDLAYLNAGKGGLSQVGKFLTIYPNDDLQIVRLALELDQATAGLKGPLVLSDRCLRSGSLVHYRYGSFINLMRQNSMGQMVPSIVNSQGEFEEDVRAQFSAPAWVADPFEAQGLLEPVSPRSPLINDRYLTFGSLYQSAKGNLYLALDVDSQDVNNCVIKEARRDVYLDTGVMDAVSLLKNERFILERLSAFDCCPKVYDYFESEGDAYLVLEYLEGMNLKSYLASRSSKGIYFEEPQIIEFGLQLCSILQILHSNGIVHRDLKPGNIHLNESGKIRLLDFELAYDSTKSTAEYPNLGTRGYNSPQQTSGLKPTVADDIFGLGSLLYFLATNSDPSLAPREWSFTELALEKLNPQVQPRLESIIAGCVETEVSQRYGSAEQVAEALTAISRSELISHNISAPPAVTGNSPSYLDLASAIGKHLCSLAQPMERGVSWRSTHPQSYGAIQRDIQAGASGIALFLMDLFRYTQSDIFLETAERACDWLNSIDYRKDHFLPGLYVGEGGVGLINLILGQVLEDQKHLDISFKVADEINKKLPSSPDLFNGLAGCGLYFLILSRLEDSYLRNARLIGDRLVSSAECVDNVCTWGIPSGYGVLSEEKFLGFAHGAAGIGYFLLELFAVTGCETYKEYADRAANFIIAKSEPALNDGSGINWPDHDQGEVQSLFWCHGAPGIVRFLLRLSEVGKDATHSETSRRAGMLVSKASGWLNPTQCHGLSSSIECLLDLYQSDGNDHWLERAFDLGDILRTHGVEQDGVLLWPSEEPTILTPDFMVGYSGVAETFLRLYDPRFHPHLITSQYFNEHVKQPTPD